MNLTRRKGSRAVAALLLFAIAQIGLQVGLAEPNKTTVTTAIPQQVVARLTTRNNQPITVNGLSANTGASILTGATIETGADQSATVDLGPLGELEISPNTKLVLTYDDQGNVKAAIVFGCAVLTAKKNATGELETDKGSVGKTDPATGGTLRVCNPPGGATPADAAAAGGGGLFGLGVPATIAIIAGAGAAASTPFFFQDNPSGSAP
jgi:hypothetical protein